jgi:hypothetical protein
MEDIVGEVGRRPYMPKAPSTLSHSLSSSGVEEIQAKGLLGAVRL